MRKLLIILFVFLGLITKGQSAARHYDTTFLTNLGTTWNARVDIPASFYSQPTWKWDLIIFFVGLGEFGTDTLQLSKNGPTNYIKGGWNGAVAINGSQTHNPVFVSLQPPSFYTPPQFERVIDSLITTYHAFPGNVHMCGISAGSQLTNRFVMYQVTNGVSVYGSKIRSIVNVVGETPSQDGSGLPYASCFAAWAGLGGREAGFEQSSDFRDIQTIIDTLNHTLNKSFYFSTSYGGGGHCCWQNEYGDSTGLVPLTYNFGGRVQNVYQWMVTQGLDTTATYHSGSFPAPTGYAGPAQFIQLPTSSVTLSGTATPGSGASITSTTWSVVVDSMGLLHGGLTIASPPSLTTTLSGITHWTNIVVKLHILQSDGQTLDTTMHIQVDPAHNSSAPRKLWAVPTQTSPSYEVDLPTTAGTVTGALPGDSIFIPAPSVGKNYDLIRFGWMSGTRGQPIIITADSAWLVYHGRIVANSYLQFVQFNFRHLVHVTGGGADAVQGLLCNHIEIRGLYIDSAANGAGAFIKTQEDTTTANWEHRFPNYDMVSIIFDSCKVMNTQGNGIYFGSTNPWGTDGGQPPGLPPRMDSVQAYADSFINIGQTAISVSNSRDGASIHDNYCNNIGIGPGNAGGPFAIGIEFGANTSGVVYNNKLVKVLSNGIEVFGYGTIDTYSNSYDSCGWNTTGSAQNTYISNDNVAPAGHFETNPAQSLIIRNSTFTHLYPGIGAEAAAIRAFNSGGTQNAMNVHDNSFCIPGANPVTWQSTYILGSPSPILANNILSCGVIPGTHFTIPVGTRIILH